MGGRVWKDFTVGVFRDSPDWYAEPLGRPRKATKP